MSGISEGLSAGPGRRPRRGAWFWGAVLGVALAGVAALAWALGRSATGVGRTRTLSDGTHLELRMVVLTNQFTYQHDARRWYHRLLEPVWPSSLRPGSWPSASSGSIGYGTRETTNLMVVTVRSGSPRSGAQAVALGRVVALDGTGNLFDAAWAGATLGVGGETVQLWHFSAFPRRESRLGLRFLGMSGDTVWTNAAEFWISNPVPGEFPQWEPEPLPQVRSAGPVEVILRGFESGGELVTVGEGVRATGGPRRTRCVLGFEREGREVEGWSVHRLTVGDATGNRWHTDFEVHSGRNPLGVLDFLGAVWPGESAWQLEVDVVRTGEFEAGEVWEGPVLRVPERGEVQGLEAGWERKGVRARLVALAGPMAEHALPHRWIGKYWGEEDRERVVSLALDLSTEGGRWRVVLAGAEDESGRRVELVAHNGHEEQHQAVLLKVPEGARELRLRWSLQPIRTVRFLARPEFVGGAGR